MANKKSTSASGQINVTMNHVWKAAKDFGNLGPHLTQSGKDTNNTQINKLWHMLGKMTDAFNNAASKINKSTIDIVNSMGKVSSSLGDTAGKLSKLTNNTITKSGEQLEKLTNTISSSISKVAPNINKDDVKKVSSLNRVVSTSIKNLNDLNKKKGEEISDASLKFQKAGHVFNNAITSIASSIKEKDLKKVSDLGKSVAVISKDIDTLSSKSNEDITKASDNLNEFTNEVAKQVNVIGSSVDSDSLNAFKTMASSAGKFSEDINNLGNMDETIYKTGMERSKSIGNHEANILQKFNKFDPKLINSLGNMGAGVLKKAEGYIKLAGISNGDLSKAMRRDNKIAWANFNRMQKMNELSQDKAREDRTKWFTELRTKGVKTALFGEKDPVTGKKKSGTGLLGGDIKSGILNGLKGMLIGGILGVVTKVFSTVIKVITMPLQVMKKLASGIVGFLKKSLNSAETFKKLIEMVMMPFTLLFTLLFAPILMRLSPLLVELVNKVVEKWDVLDQIGEKIAYILGYFFDDNNWFSLGNLIDMLIGLLDEFSEVALSTFTTALSKGEEGMQVIGDVVANIIHWAANKFIEFMASSEGVSLFDTIGRVVGELLYDAVKIAFVTIIPLVMSNIGMFKGIFEALMSDIANGFRDLVLSPISNWFIDIGNFFIEWLNDIYGFFGWDLIPYKEHTSFSLSGTSSAIQQLSDALSSGTVYNSDGSTNYVQTFNNWSTTNWNNVWSDRSNMYSLKGTDT